MTLYRLIVEACTDAGDVVWEPFGGTCPGAPVCMDLERRYFAAEPNPAYFEAALSRVRRHTIGSASLPFGTR